jgi:hypothetical protein
LRLQDLDVRSTLDQEARVFQDTNIGGRMPP